MTWTNLSVGGGEVQGLPPAPRGGLGLAFAEGGLYVFGGWGDSGVIHAAWNMHSSTDTQEEKFAATALHTIVAL